jgi:hypothetical protein
MAGAVASNPNTLQATAPNGATIILTQDIGVCKNGAKVAKYIAPNKVDTLDGCWKLSDSAPVVSIAWLDGDGSAVPAKVFKPAETI